MYITSVAKLPGFNLLDKVFDLFGLEPLFIEDQYVESFMRAPFRDFYVLEQEPKVYKKRYYKGCLEKNPKAKIIVCRYGGIGDIQWVIPSIREIKKRFPEVKIRLAIFEKDREMFYNCDLIDSIITKTYPTEADLKWCDYVLDFFDTVEGIYTQTGESKIKNPIDISAEIVGYKLSDYLGFYKIEPSESLQAKSLLKQFGVKDDDILLGFPLVSSSPHRSWTMQDKLAEMLSRYNDKIKIITFSCDQHALHVNYKIQDKNLKNVILTHQQLTFRQVVAMANECKLILSNDTGLVNILAALKKDIIAIYTTVPKETRINRYPSVTGIQSKEKCSPCFKLSDNCEFNNRCIYSITPEEVFLEITKKLEGK